MADKRIHQLNRFLLDTAADGYANADAPITRPVDGSHDLLIKRSNYNLHDNWFGGEPFGGREVVSDSGKAFWMMVYFGAIEDPKEKPADVYIGLREALAKPDKDLPVRGPKRHKASNGYEYGFDYRGTLERFRGDEWIQNPKGEVVYRCEVSGGMVDL